MNPLNDLLVYFTRSLLLHKGFYDFCATAKINFSHWPECHARQVALKYQELRQTLGHDMASVQLSGYLENLPDTGTYPRDSGLLRAIYQSSLGEYRAKKLAQQLLEDPLDAEKHIANFQILTAPEDSYSLAATAESGFLESVRLSQSGEALKSISNWPILSDLVGGFNPGRVGMLLAQTGFGKTTAAVNLSLCAASKMKVFYFNMEMLSQDFLEKMLVAEMQAPFKTYKNAPLALKDRFAQALSRLYNKNLEYTGGRALTPAEIFAMCRRHKNKHGLDLVVIDYDQKLVMETSRETPEWKALQIAVEQFEALAKELNCFVLMLAQESGDGEVSGSKRSKFPASTVLRFYKNVDGKYLIQAVKNRFGRFNAAVEVNYESDKATVTEKCEYLEIPRKQESSLVRYTE